MTTLAMAQDWLCKNLQHFDPLAWANKDAAFVRRKAFAELAVLAHVADADTPSAISTLIAERANDPAYHALLRRHPRQILLYSAPLMHVWRRGQATPATCALIGEAIGRPQVFALERSPHRLMDLWHFLTVVDRCPTWLDPAAILATSALAHPPTPFDCTLSEAYAFTHDILFLKNFGADGPGFDLGLDYPLDRMTIALTIGRFMADGNSDIVLEYLLCLGLMNKLHADDLQLVWSWIQGRNGDAPFIRGPHFHPDPALTATGLDPNWVVHYHTTLVACATLILAGRRGWTEARTAPRLFDAPLDEILAWGEVVRHLNRYEIAMAVALTDRIPLTSAYGLSACAEVERYLASITDVETAIVGHWTDEFCAAGDATAQEDLRNCLHAMSSLTREILPGAALRH